MDVEASEKVSLAKLEDVSELEHDNLYNKMDRLGYNSGPSSQCLSNIWRGSRVDEKSGELYHFGYGDIEFTEDERDRFPVKYNVPPIVLDAAFVTTIASHFESTTFLAIPRRIEQLTFFPPDEHEVCYNRWPSSSLGGNGNG